MTDTLIIIFSTISIICILLACSYTLTELNRRKQTVKIVFSGLYRWIDYRIRYGKYAAKTLDYKWEYLLDLIMIPIKLFIGLMLINQLGIGELRFRMDLQHFMGMAFWIVYLCRKISKNK